MRGEMDRECRARGGKTSPPGLEFNAPGSPITASFKGKRAPNAVDDSTSRGSGPLFRKRGGKVPKAFEKHDEMEHADAKKPHMGRPGRRMGGAMGGHSDLSPTTSADRPRKAKGLHTMPESAKTP